MKNNFSILFALLILFSGMHISIATHYCGGQIAATKWSFSEQNATCGMKLTKNTCPSHNSVSTNCCHNKVSVFTVDNNYSPSSQIVQETSTTFTQLFYVPVNSSLYALNSLKSNTNTKPPGNVLTSNVSLTNICVFRI